MNASCKCKSRSPTANEVFPSQTAHLHRAVWLRLLDSRGKESFHVQTLGSQSLAGPHHCVHSLVPGRGETSLPIHMGHIQGKPTPQPRRQGRCCVCPTGTVLIKKPENQSFLAASSDKTGFPQTRCRRPHLRYPHFRRRRGCWEPDSDLQTKYRAPSEIRISDKRRINVWCTYAPHIAWDMLVLQKTAVSLILRFNWASCILFTKPGNCEQGCR